MIDVKQIFESTLQEASVQINEATVNVSAGVDVVKFYSAITNNRSGLVFERRGEEYTVKGIDKYIGENLFKELASKPKTLFAIAIAKDSKGNHVELSFYLTRSFEIVTEVK